MNLMMSIALGILTLAMTVIFGIGVIVCAVRYRKTNRALSEARVYLYSTLTMVCAFMFGLCIYTML